MTKKQVTPKTQGPKTQKYASSKLPRPEFAKINKPTPALTVHSTKLVRPLQPPITSEARSSLIDLDYIITNATLEFDLFEVHNWCHEKFVKKVENDISLWDSNLPKYVVPITHLAQDLIRLCQLHYVLD